MKKGDKVIFTGELKKLDKGTVGEIVCIVKDWAVVIYPENIDHNKIYCHSARLTELKIEE